MNIALINPKLKTWSPNVYAPLGLMYIASALEDEGHKLSIIDMNAQKISDERLFSKLDQVDIVGITGLITEYNEVVRLVNIIKNDNPLITVILGGALASTHTEKLLESTFADYVVVGEAERTIVKLVSAINDNKDTHGIKGVAYASGSKVIINEAAELIENLDEIKFPARHLLNLKSYTTHHFKSYGMKVGEIKSATLISSRGCSYACSFCYRDVCGRRWRCRSAQNLIDEIKELHEKYGFNGFVFNDDTFVVKRKRVLEFCQLLKIYNMDIKWYCNGRVNLMDEEMIKAMSESGCVGIAYGIESGNQNILDSVHKEITLEQVENITALTKKYGIHVTGYFMIGILGDSRETIKQTFDFAKKIDLDFYGFTLTSPVIGTPMYYQALEKGIKVQKELEDFSFNLSVNMTTDCTNEELEQFNKDAFRIFTIEKRYGKDYVFNYKLWVDGLKSLIFLIGKRDYKWLIKKAWQLVFERRRSNVKLA